MNNLRFMLPLASGAVSLAFAAVLLARAAGRRSVPLLFWGAGMLLYACGSLCEAWYGLFGWSPAVFRLWYLCGAVLAAAWLGQGTIHLLAPRGWAYGLLAVLVLGTLYGIARVLGAGLDPAAAGLAAGGELSGRAIVTPGVRMLTPFFNVYGTLALVGGAAWSAWLLWRRRTHANRAIGNALIAVGALLPALGGTASRLGAAGLLSVGELLGAVLMFAGFLLSSARRAAGAGDPPASAGRAR